MRAPSRPREAGSVSGEPRVAVVGCGLIGASLAACLSERGVAVVGCDRRPLDPLIERGWIEARVPLEEVVEQPVVVLATPVGDIVELLGRLPFRRGQLLTDVGSVKAPVMAAAGTLPRGVAFVGGHPMAGAAASGFEAARPDLFVGARWAIVPGEAPAAAVGRVEELVGLVGATTVRCSAEEHDRVVARTSHLPQLLATLLAAELETMDRQLVDALLGPGGRGFLRLAASSFAVWRDVLEQNRVEIAGAVEALYGGATLPPKALEEAFAAAGRLARNLALEEPPRAPSVAPVSRPPDQNST